MASRRVHEEVDVREWITILWACLVQVSEVDVYSPLAVCFFDHDYIGQPFEVVDFPNEICL